MSLPYLQYALPLAVDRTTIALVETSVSDEELILALKIDEVVQGEVRLLRPYLPGVAVSLSHVAIWGGGRSYFVPRAGGKIVRFDIDPADEIHLLYPLDSLWIFVCELSVRLVDPAKPEVLDRYDHDEVLLQAWWSGDELVVVDFQGRQLRVLPLPVESKLLVRGS
jgi:DNA-binding XRE family transcriptional regulator